MEKQIITTTLSGLFIKHEPWDNAHILWFKDAAEKLDDPKITEWINNPNYFKGVDLVMKRLYPDLNNKQRTIKARETYFDSVCKYIKQNPNVKNLEIIKYFKSLKDKFEIALITSLSPAT